MKERLFTGWNAQRWLRAVFAAVFLFAGATRHEPVAFVAAAFFGVQALFNIGCCGSAVCAPRASGRKGDPSEVVYEEIT